MIEDTPQAVPMRSWWSGLTETERDAWKDRAGRTFEAGGKVYTRNDRDLARAAYDLHREESRCNPINRCGETMRNPMRYTLGTAAKATGKAKSTILRAVKSGTISAHKADDGSYEIDPSELHRVFPLTVAQPAQSNDTQPHEEHHTTLRLKLETLEAERQRERDQMRATIDDLRTRLDRAEDHVTGILAAPLKPRRWWPW